MKTAKVLQDESGVALIIALFMMVIISLIGLASSSSSIFEIKLSGNKRGATDAFYTADGGAQSVLANIGNFNTSAGYEAVTTSDLPVELQTESIDQKLTSPALSLPTGISFNDPPQVAIYHTTKDSLLQRELLSHYSGQIEDKYLGFHRGDKKSRHKTNHD